MGGNLSFDAASVQAIGGDAGGTISGRSFNGSLTGTAGGELDAGGSPVGTVTPHAVRVWSRDYAGTVTGTLVTPVNVCGGTPHFEDDAASSTRVGVGTAVVNPRSMV